MKLLIKKILGELAIAKIRSLIRVARLRWMMSASNSLLLSKLHYICFFNEFDREAQAVLTGHLMYEYNKTGSESVNYCLRRCIHRLEKGLIMRPRKAVFGLDYISEAVDAYIASCVNDISDSVELGWAFNVLSEYFDVVEYHPLVNKEKRRFYEYSTTVSKKCRDNIPYCRKVSPSSPVSIEALKQLSVIRRSVRWYQPRRVPRELIDKALEVASLAPSACNRQPFEYQIFDDPELVQKIAELPPGVSGYNHNIPVIAVLVGKLRAYPHPRDRHVIYIDASLSAMAFMYALEAVGLSSCSINWPDISEREKLIKELLSLKGDEKVIMLISIGYPDPEGMVPASKKLPLSLLRKYNGAGS